MVVGRAHRFAPVWVEFVGPFGEPIQHGSGMGLVVRRYVRADLGGMHDRLARLDVDDATRLSQQRPGRKVHAQAQWVAVAAATDLGLGPLRRVGVLARADFAGVRVLLDPFGQRQRGGQPGNGIEIAFFVQKVPGIRHAQTACDEAIGVLATFALGDADQQLAECAQRGPDAVLQPVQPRVDVRDGLAARLITAG